ncbi:MAG TPA: hypothetical protein VFY14_06395 [Streptomyces sp.]|nr:hypothetical protein [Streptomyces sp.]
MLSIDETNVGIAQTAAQVREALLVAMALAAARQVEARTFITTNGRAALAGHTVMQGQIERGRQA